MTLKKIEAVFPHEKLDAVFNALTSLDISGFTYFSVKGRGARPREMVSSGRGGRVEATHNENSFIYVVVTESQLPKVIDTITTHAGTGAAGEGKIFIYNLEDAVDIGTKKRGESSL
ncbi:MAG: P-II family nitrogen regulator [Nitrosopumilaceae archaeon]